METQRNAPSFDKRDRISILPDALIHLILRFIDMKYAVQTSALSRRWRYIWTSLPTLNFNTELFYSPVTDNSNGFIDFVDKVLILRDSSNIQRFHLDWQSTLDNSTDESDNITSRLNNTWILAAVRRNVEELHIKGVLNDNLLEIPPCLTTCTSLTKLELHMIGEYGDIVLPNSMSLPRLKYLKLWALVFRDEKLTNTLFSSCPALESLIIHSCVFYEDLNISSLKLKHFELSSCDDSEGKVKLYAPNLTFFSCADWISKDYSLENLCSLVTADIDIADQDRLQGVLCPEKKGLHAQRMIKFLTALHNVKALTVSHQFLEVFSSVPEILDNHSLQFFNLQCLKLQASLSRDCMHAIVYLLKISPNIESFSLNLFQLYATTTGENNEAGLSDSVACMLYHLKFVEIRGFFGCKNILKFLESLLKNAAVLVKLVLSSSDLDSPARARELVEFKNKLLSFPRASSNVSILFKSY